MSGPMQPSRTRPLLLLFDLDGTLVDSRTDLATATNRMRALHGLPPIDIPTVVSYVGDGLAKLAERAMEDLENEDEVGLGRLLESSEDFLTKHLLLWIPKFLERMQKAKTQHLYPQLCVVLDAFLRRDRDTLSELRAALETA